MSGKSPKKIIAIASHFFTNDALDENERVDYIRKLEKVTDAQWEKMKKAEKDEYKANAKIKYTQLYAAAGNRVPGLGAGYGNDPAKRLKNKEAGARLLNIDPNKLQPPANLPPSPL